MDQDVVPWGLLFFLGLHVLHEFHHLGLGLLHLVQKLKHDRVRGGLVYHRLAHGRGVMLKAESFLLLRFSIDATVFARVFERIVQ